MDANTKKTALRMIPYGLYVLTAKGKDDAVAAATVNWVTQASFAPPLVVVGVKTDSHAHALIKESKAFALNVLGKGQTAMAFTFFKPATREGQTISGEPFRWGSTGAPVLERTPAFVECRLVDTVERGDHSVFVGEVVEAGLPKPVEGRAERIEKSVEAADVQQAVADAARHRPIGVSNADLVLERSQHVVPDLFHLADRAAQDLA